MSRNILLPLRQKVNRKHIYKSQPLAQTVIDQDPDSPTPPLTMIPNIFTRVRATRESNAEIAQACAVVRNNPNLKLPLQNHIIQMILLRDKLPDPGYTARTILGADAGADPGGLETFVEMLIAGIKFLRTGGTLESVLDGDHPEDLRSSCVNYPKLSDRSLTRFGPICEISGDHGPTANLQDVPIFPYAISEAGSLIQQRPLFELLCCLWKPDIVEKIIMQCDKKDDPAGVNHFKNGIFMSGTCRKAFNELQFYLLPVVNSFTPTRYDVKWHWIYKPVAHSQRNFHQQGFVTDELELHYKSFKTGDRITLKTVDPIRYPLPDPGLLFARAFLAKIALPMEVNVHNKLVLRHDYDDYGNDRASSSNGEEPRPMAKCTTSAIEIWMDGVPEGCGIPIL